MTRETYGLNVLSFDSSSRHFEVDAPVDHSWVNKAAQAADGVHPVCLMGLPDCLLVATR